MFLCTQEVTEVYSKITASTDNQNQWYAIGVKVVIIINKPQKLNKNYYLLEPEFFHKN